MNNVLNGNAIEAVANVFAGKNGPVLGGILGILGLVGIHYLVNGNYRLAGTTEHGGFTFEPATNATTPEVIDADEPPAEEAVDE